MSFEYKSAPPKNKDASKKRQTSRNKEESNIGEGMTRRGFLKGLATFGAAIAVGGGVRYLEGENETDVIVKENPD